MILTVSRMEADRSANPGYRAFLANGFNVARTFVLFGWEVILEWIASGATRDDILSKHPQLGAADVEQALAYVPAQ